MREHERFCFCSRCQLPCFARGEVPSRAVPGLRVRRFSCLAGQYGDAPEERCQIRNGRWSSVSGVAEFAAADSGDAPCPGQDRMHRSHESDRELAGLQRRGWVVLGNVENRLEEFTLVLIPENRPPLREPCTTTRRDEERDFSG